MSKKISKNCNKNGGAYWNRTNALGVADPCLSAWLMPHVRELFPYLTSHIYSTSRFELSHVSSTIPLQHTICPGVVTNIILSL